MKSKIIYFLLLFFVWGCSKKAPQSNSPPQSQKLISSSSLPFQVAIVENLEIKEMNNISNQAVMFFNMKDYDSLDAYARKLRSSKENYEGGGWKFYFVYVGLDLSEEASEREWTAHLAALQDWINARPDSITARVALANNLISYAWKARGSNWANKVTDEGWQLFNQRLVEAVKVLNEAKSLKEQCPFFWSVMLTTELGLPTERSQYDATFEEAIRAWPDYAPYYNRRAYYLLPRWYGAEGEWESDLAKSADRIGGEEGDLLYARVVWATDSSHFFTNIFTECKLSWPRVKSGFAMMEKQFPNSLAAKSEEAHLAVLANDALTARKCFEQLEGKVDLSVWRSENHFIEFANWTYAH